MSLPASPWDGFCGGIVTFDAKTLNLNNQTIDVSAQGFRGGKLNANTNPAVQHFWNTYCTTNDKLFGEKGESIAGAPIGSYALSSKLCYGGGSYARGAPGNAGGGGNDHNSGGGGGANIGSGGQGGAAWGNAASGDMTVYWPSVLPDGGYYNGTDRGFIPNGGMGGTGSGTPDPFRIWMGGGGGGGHQNDNAATGGANGGGIILATARIVTGTGSLIANGGDAQPTIIARGGIDGAGGGGGGGTIVFGFDSQTGAKISYSVAGGAGGDNNAQDTPHGPGGGGGGGGIIVSAYPPNVSTLSVAGGRYGMQIRFSSQWGANKGQEGKMITSDKLQALYTYSCDHGDDPASFLDAAHQIKTISPSLGIPGDSEPMALNKPPHETDALGDDLNGSPNDEDGVQQPFEQISTAQSKYNVKVTVTNPQNSNVYLCGWIDFNGKR